MLFDDGLAIAETMQIWQWWQVGAVLFPERELPTGRAPVGQPVVCDQLLGGLNVIGYRSDPPRRLRRVSLRVSLCWQEAKIDAIRRKPTEEDASAKLLMKRGLLEEVPSLLGFP